MRRTLLACLVLLATSRNAAAQVKEVPRAEALFYDGVRALHDHRYEQARARFDESLALARRGSALVNLAKAEWNLGLHVEALAHLREALARGDLSPELQDQGQRAATHWYTLVGHVLVQTDPGASLRVDGAMIAGSAPIADPIDVEPGLRVLETHLGDRSGRAEVDAKAGVVVEANAFVAAPSPALPPAVSEGAVVPATERRPEQPPRTPAPDESSTPFWTTRRTVGAGIATFGVASLVVGGVFFALASGDENRARDAAPGLGSSGCTGPARAPACSAQDDAVASERTHGTVSRIAVGAGAAALVTGVAMFLWPTSRTSNVALRTDVRPGGANIDLEGRF